MEDERMRAIGEAAPRNREEGRRRFQEQYDAAKDGMG
jgi:hypothetical protein